MPTRVKAYESAGVERLQLQRVVVELGLRGRVACEEDLETAVQQEAVNIVRSHPPAHTVAGFEHNN